MLSCPVLEEFLYGSDAQSTALSGKPGKNINRLYMAKKVLAMFFSFEGC